ncbi:hypothetical protein CHT99_09355 [Sphingobacterium cellulitidis]|nr:hypothetical protein CHT99_09355 [Sphingobacterium cellulitidis]
MEFSCIFIIELFFEIKIHLQQCSNYPNVTDKKFPGNPTQSYRSKQPLKIIAEVKDWIRLTPEELKKWKDNLAKIHKDPDAKIIN